MQYNLNGKKVACLVADGFEQSELESPVKALRDAGAKVEIVSPNSKEVKGWDEDNWGRSVPVDVTIDDAAPSDYDALLLPGGVLNPDTLRQNHRAVAFVRQFFRTHKPVAAICHGPQMLIEAGVVEGRKLTSFGSIKQDLINAGANWVDEEVVVDQGLVTSRSPADLKAFNAKAIEEVAEGKHAHQHA
ncbi:MAG: type 1 glutamine amidotransferase domain-containing protein [Verrucomicrobiota bacterium JB022]|nr:type 1 glutamine amidotransferase domain-containing protein [Verrucomicrobiota bacterium JB022]